jgi:hypothetical protein
MVGGAISLELKWPLIVFDKEMTNAKDKCGRRFATLITCYRSSHGSIASKDKRFRPGWGWRIVYTQITQPLLPKTTPQSIQPLFRRLLWLKAGPKLPTFLS